MQSHLITTLPLRPLPSIGNNRAAAVFVGLFEKPGVEGLHVLLTTRAKTMR